MMQVLWAPKAVEDLQALLAHIAEDSPVNARLVRDRIFKTVRALSDFQFGTPSPRAGTFKAYIPKTSHFVLYRLVGTDTLEIQAFLHAARDWTLVDWEEEP